MEYLGKTDRKFKIVQIIQILLDDNCCEHNANIMKIVTSPSRNISWSTLTQVLYVSAMLLISWWVFFPLPHEYFLHIS